MKNKDIVVLKKILEYCSQVEETCNRFNNSFEKYRDDFVFTNAANMCILQIGELCKVLSDDVTNQYDEIPWKDWKGIRDIFAHQYSNLDYESAWDTIQKDLPNLKKSIQMIEQEYNV